MFALVKNRVCSAVIVGTISFAVGGGSALAGLVGLDPNSSDSVKLSDLLDDTTDGVIVGDKIFDGFVYSTIGDMPMPEDVNVLGFTDLDGNYGISFHGAFIDMPGGGPSDALIRFTVEVDDEAQARGWVISDAHLSIGGIGVGDDSVFTVDESFEGSNESLSVFASTLGQGGQSLSDWTYFVPTVTKLRVSKDIFALAGENAIVPARATVIDQSFSQVPEPAALTLLAISLAGAMTTARRRQG